MPAAYDIFLSHAWADGDRPQQIADALTKAGLRVWIDAKEIADFEGITGTVTKNLAKSKALVAYYSKTYPLRRACQWELTAAFLAAQSDGDPRRRVLVINPEQGAEHIHPIELRDAKFRAAPTGDGASLQELAQSVVKHVATLDGPLADIHPLTAPTWYGTTPVGSTRFVGRLAEMWEVHSLLHRGDVTQITGAAVATGGIGQVSGLGGVGKSLLAEEYALHFGAAYPGGVFWLRAYGNDDAKAALGPEAREALRTDQVRGLAEDLQIKVQGLSAREVEAALRGAIEGRGQPCLWVVDDVPNGLDGEALRRWFAPHALARTLITTRSREYGALARGIDLSVLAPEEAGQLLTSRKPPVGEAEQEQARELARDLGYHALALDVTASALQNSVAAAPFADFRAKLARPDKDALALAETLADALPNGHEKSIAQTMLRSIRGLGVEGQDFLRLASLLAVAPIPASLVTAVFEEADKLSHEDAADRASLAFKQVTSASLGEIAGEARSVHTLVSRAVRFDEKAAPERTQALRAAAIEALGAEIAAGAEDPRLHKQIEFHVAHARQVVAKLENVSEAGLVRWMARYEFVRGLYVSARALYERELEFNRRVQGPEHSDTLTSMNDLALSLSAQGDEAGARKLIEETLGVRRRVLGPEHPHTLTSMMNLAQTLHAQGDLAGARKLQEETLAILRRVPEHPYTLTLIGNLARTLRSQGDFSGARKLQEEVLAFTRRVLGPGHPDTLVPMSNLATTLSEQGDLAGARKLQEEVLAIRHRVLGAEHPDTLTVMNNLAETLRAQGDLAGARKLQEKTLDIERRVRGREHPSTLSSISNLAVTLLTQGDLAGARRLQEEVLAIRRRVLGPEHPDTLNSMGNLASTLTAQGDQTEARKLKEETLALRRRLLGPEHPLTLVSMNNLAETLRAQGDLAGARKLHEEALEIRRRVLGPEHPDTLNSMSNLASMLTAQGDQTGARKLKEETLAVFRRVLGPDHPDTLIAMNNLAETLRAQGDLAGARTLHEEALTIRRRVLGREHPSTTNSAWNLFLTLQGLGEAAAARAVLERDLLWLLERDPATLGALQRKIREYVKKVVSG